MPKCDDLCFEINTGWKSKPRSGENIVAPGFNPGESAKGRNRPRANVEKRNILISDEMEQMKFKMTQYIEM
jgi:hypothetical protein